MYQEQPLYFCVLFFLNLQNIIFSAQGVAWPAEVEVYQWQSAMGKQSRGGIGGRDKDLFQIYWEENIHVVQTAAAKGG